MSKIKDLSKNLLIMKTIGKIEEEFLNDLLAKTGKNKIHLQNRFVLKKIETLERELLNGFSPKDIDILKYCKELNSPIDFVLSDFSQIN